MHVETQRPTQAASNGNAHQPGRRSIATSVQDTFTMLAGGHGPMGRNVQVMLFTVDLTHDVVREWLPPGLKPPPRPRVHFWLAQYGSNAPEIPYREAAIMLEARFRGRTVCHCPWVLADDDTFIVWGRDMMGYPKKNGTIEINREGDAFDIEVVRRGERLWHITGEVDSATDLDLRAPVMPAETINVWGIPFCLPFLIKYENTKDVKYRHPATANLEITGGRTDPLETLDISNGQAATGQAFLTDIVLPEPTRLPYWLWGMTGIVRPVGITSPIWLLRHYIFRTL